MPASKKSARTRRTAAASADGSGGETPRTTHPPARSRREEEQEATKFERRLDAHPDRIDIRDWFYQPSLAPLPDSVVNLDGVPAILDQGIEGACTGYALAAVINYLLNARGLPRRVSPRMLYEMARRYDEWPRENYSGSSARGAMKGWMAHGVCVADSWPADNHGAKHLTPAVARDAQQTPGGAYFRIKHRQIRDMHAAINEVGVIYCTIQVHDGWQVPGPERVALPGVKHKGVSERGLPVIARVAGETSGHAVAFVGYTSDGFIVQNSWADDWGEGGFALLPYEDYMLHATDVWVAQVGVPIRVSIWEHPDLEVESESEGLQQAARAIPLSEIRPYAIDVGPDGRLSDTGRYWTKPEDIERLFAESIPAAAKDWKKRRVMLYLHSGFHDEERVARRIIAFRDVLLRNEVYPVHVMWESGVMDSWQKLLRESFVGTDGESARIREWLKEVRGGSLEVRDDTFELTVAGRGARLWRELKENARKASEDGGAMQLLVGAAKDALGKVADDRRQSWELHVVAHSIGSIFTAYAVKHLASLGVGFKSLHLMAPAMSADLFREQVLPYVEDETCPQPTLYVLDDEGERDDDVGPYGRSLLFLISNAFEERDDPKLGDRGTPILGMERFVSDRGVKKRRYVVPELNRLFKREVGGLPSLVVAGRDGGPKSTSRSETHAGFDSDEWTLNSILRRILGNTAPRPPFRLRDLQY